MFITFIFSAMKISLESVVIFTSIAWFVPVARSKLFAGGQLQVMIPSAAFVIVTSPSTAVLKITTAVSPGR